MVSRSQKTVLNLFLIIVMVLQPVMASYAMASMSFMYVGSVGTGHPDNGQSITAHHQMKDMSDFYQQNNADQKGPNDDCCQTAFCGAAVLTSSLTSPDVMPFQNHDAYHFTWKGIALPSEIRPPRII